MNETEIVMGLFEAHAHNNRLTGLRVSENDKAEDEFGTPFYTDEITRNRFFSFAAGLRLGGTR